jgi:hypothetical protein
MADIRAILTKPNTKSRKVNTSPFICDGCSLAYSRKHYQVLYDGKKLVYFLLYPDWQKKSRKFFLCHDCFYKSAMQICEEFELPVLSIGLKQGRKWHTLEFYYSEYSGPCDPTDLDVF